MYVKPMSQKAKIKINNAEHVNFEVKDENYILEVKLSEKVTSREGRKYTCSRYRNSNSN